MVTDHHSPRNSPLHLNTLLSHRLSSSLTPPVLSAVLFAELSLMRLFYLVAALALLSLSFTSFVSAFTFPDCSTKPLQGTPICDASLPYLQRARVCLTTPNSVVILTSPPTPFSPLPVFSPSECSPSSVR